MQLQFSAFGCKSWELLDDRIILGNETIMLDDVADAKGFSKPTMLTNGVIQLFLKNGKVHQLGVGNSYKGNYDAALNYISKNRGGDETRKKIKEKEERESIGLVYDLQGVRGRYMKVYDNKAIIGTKAGLGSFVAGNVSDGEKNHLL